MNKIAFILKTAPHGNAAGREALDALLATSALTEDIALFFVGDGVFHLLADQQPMKVLARDYIATFGVLPLYDITQCYASRSSLEQRGLPTTPSSVLDVDYLDDERLQSMLAQFDVVLTF